MPIQLSCRLARFEDLEKLASMINAAYRGESGRKGWTTESDLLAGQRIGEPQLREILSEPNSAVLLAENERELYGCVHVKALEKSKSYFGMLTVNVEKQSSGAGSFLMRKAEQSARDMFGSTQMEMTVVAHRPELVAWYERRGYAKTGETRPFPYGDERFGVPLRADLYFEVFTKQI